MNFEIKEQKGVSLLFNLIISIAIMAALTTITIPFLRKYQPNLKLNGVARELTSDLRYAQQLNVTEQVVHKVKFFFDDNTYRILKVDTATTTIKEVIFPPEVNYQQITGLTDNTVVFNSYGGVSESGTITLINTNNKSALINVKPSGYIKLE